AEDGIRDLIVTGVQTCALPILHYDIMVTLIIIFVLFSPRVINFNDKPVARNPHPTDVVVTTDAEGHLFYQVAASAISPGDDQARSEERRVGKGCGAGWGAEEWK